MADKEVRRRSRRDVLNKWRIVGKES